MFVCVFNVIKDTEKAALNVFQAVLFSSFPSPRSTKRAKITAAWGWIWTEDRRGTPTSEFLNAPECLRALFHPPRAKYRRNSATSGEKSTAISNPAKTGWCQQSQPGIKHSFLNTFSLHTHRTTVPQPKSPSTFFLVSDSGSWQILLVKRYPYGAGVSPELKSWWDTLGLHWLKRDPTPSKGLRRICSNQL